jgi:hypothetical protein
MGIGRWARARSAQPIRRCFIGGDDLCPVRGPTGRCGAFLAAIRTCRTRDPFGAALHWIFRCLVGDKQLFWGGNFFSWKKANELATEGGLRCLQSGIGQNMKTHFFSRRAGSVRQEVAQFFFSLSNLFSHKVTNVLTGSERDPLILLSPPLQPHGEWSSSGWGSPEFFPLFFPAGISARYGREPARCTRELCPTGRKHGDTHLITSCRRSWSPCRRSVSWSSRCHRVGRGGGLEVGQVSGRYANVPCPPFFCDFWPCAFMILSRSARISVTCRYPPTARTIFWFSVPEF